MGYKSGTEDLYSYKNSEWHLRKKESRILPYVTFGEG